VEREARRRFGIEELWPGQEEILRSVLAGRDVVGILPTGGGKSLTFQLAGLFTEGTTVVVSPLISLMKDQEEKLLERDVPTSALNSTLGAAEGCTGLPTAKDSWRFKTFTVDQYKTELDKVIKGTVTIDNSSDTKKTPTVKLVTVDYQG
jgi:superfamily II DNA helicase RecQ